MNRMRLRVSAAIIAFVIFIAFALSVPHTRDVAEVPVTGSATSSVPLVTLHDSFKKGFHTITGSIEAPNACTSVGARASVVSDASSTESILVAIFMPSDAGVCLELPARATFHTTVSAPAHLPFIVTVNGTAATTTVL